MSSKANKVKLKTIFEEIPFYDYNALYKRLQKFADFVGLKLDALKDDSGEISFYEFEKDIVVQLLKEMGESYLIKITSHRELGKNAKEIYGHAMAFRERMIPIAEQIPDEEVRGLWLNLIDLLSRKQAHELNIALMEKIKGIADMVTNLGLNYREHLQLLQEIHEGLDRWVETRLKQVKKS